jgi:hypothetical protein
VSIRGQKNINGCGIFRWMFFIGSISFKNMRFVYEEDVYNFGFWFVLDLFWVQ